MNKQKINNQAFTLIELIIVITILAILWTIAYISMVWYIEEARDYTRLSDMHVMESSLEIFQLNSWKYPETTNGFTVTYSWSEVWTQWTFWKSTKTNIGNWDRGPNDPLTDKEYTYSVTKDRQEFLLWWVLEWEPLTSIWLFSEVNAWDIIKKAIVSWNYNWVILKTLSWANCEILSLPSIISSLPETTTNLNDILTASWLVYTWYNNLPTNYRTSKFNADGWFNFTSNKFIVYSDNNNCSDLLSSESQWTTARSTLITNIQTAYSWTVISSNWNIWQYTSVNINDSDTISLLGNSLVNNNLGWKLDLINNNVAIDNGPYAWCSNQWDILSADTVYDTCNTNDIIVCSWTWTWFTVAACNVWVTTAWTTSTSGWGFYQFWRNNLAFTISYVWNASDWWVLDAENSTATYNNSTEPNKAIMQWPCSSWYHVPTARDFDNLIIAWWWVQNGLNMSNDIKLPFWAYRIWSTGNIDTNITTYARYWTSSPNWTNSWQVTLTNTSIASFSHNWPHANAFFIRCFKD